MLHNMTEEEWDAVIAVHLKGTFVCTRAAATVFRDQRSGVVVNTGSESGLGNMGQSNYSAAKEGIVGFTRTVARDLGRYGCRCNVIRPRAATRLTLSDELREAAERARKAGEAAVDISQIEKQTPEAVAAFVTWLCSDAAANVNGQDFVVSADQVSRMTQPRPAETLFSTEAWTLDRLDAAVPATLVRGLRNEFAPKEKS
jgi:NAD(P)-dependent dehydrogenase (short-subunit alcohol dehydrogenase family)